MELRDTARTIFLEALRRLELRSVMRQKLAREDSHLRVGDRKYNLAAFSRVVILAVGKAAGPMAQGLIELLEPLPPHCVLEGLVIGASAPVQLRFRPGSHPVPDARALHAADDALALMQRCDPSSLVFVLISGGASAMMERPLDPGIGIDPLAEFYRMLVHSGLPIAAMNTLRKHLSAVKGGRLAQAAGAATLCTLLVSDVQPSMPDVIGSGPTLPDPSTLQDCRRLLRSSLPEAPPRIRAWYDAPDCPETPKPGDPAFRNAHAFTLLSSDDLWKTASVIARELGFEVVIDLTCDEWEYRRAAHYLLERAHREPAGSRPFCLISAGELSVQVHGSPGTGGRNQQFALECARTLAAQQNGSEIAVLSAGSDGIDGNSPAAGAIVDSSTVDRARAHGLSVQSALAGFNAYPLLHELGDTIETGPSQNNLRDLRLLLRGTPADHR